MTDTLSHFLFYDQLHPDRQHHSSLQTLFQNSQSDISSIMANTKMTASDVGSAGDLLRHIRGLFSTGDHADFTITVKDAADGVKQYQLHKAILRNNRLFRQAIDNKTFTVRMRTLLDEAIAAADK